MIELAAALKTKSFYRFTGPPENWLTAIKYMTWGLEQKHESRWKEIQPGDVFFIHSSGSATSLFKNAKSGIIGIGVVGSNFSIKEGPLWIHELKNNINKWPLLVPFSEIYLFSRIPPRNDWEAPNLVNNESATFLIYELLKDFIPLSQVKGFPQMGSFSTVKAEVARQILYNKRSLHVYSADKEDDFISDKPTRLEPVKNVSETFRHAGSLAMFDEIKTRIVREDNVQYSKNNELLAKAERVHSSILQNLIDIFRANGYDTLANKHVDLFAHNKDKAFLIEVKSTENNNFKSQARKGLVQLFEYDFFEIRKFVQENSLDFKEKFNLLIPSQVPKDQNYIDFINYLNVGVATVETASLNPIGKDFGFTKF